MEMGSDSSKSVVSITLAYAVPFRGGSAARRAELTLSADEVRYSVSFAFSSRTNPDFVYSYPIHPPFGQTEDRLKDYAQDFASLPSLILAYPKPVPTRFHPRMSDVGYPRIWVRYGDGHAEEINSLPISLKGDPAIEKIVGLMEKYRPEGIQ